MTAVPAGSRPTALVTGASRGIGKATALSLAQAGYDVAITARTVNDGDPSAIAPESGVVLPGSLATTAAEITRLGARAVPVRLDLLDLSELSSCIDLAIEGLGGHLDVLVNNAIYVGPGNDKLFADTDDTNIINRITGNVTAQLLITRHVLRHMLASGRGGTIANVTSAAGQLTPKGPVGSGGWSLVYAASKAGFHRMADMIALEYADQGIRSFNVNPGFVTTERVLAAGGALQFVAYRGVAPEVIGAAIAHLINDPTTPNGAYLQALDVATSLGLVAETGALP